MSNPILAELESTEPNIQLAAYLMMLDVNRVSGPERVVLLKAYQRMASHYQALVYAGMAAVADAGRELDDDPELAAETAAAEIRAALRLTRRAAESELGFAQQLRWHLPEVWDALRRGVIDLRRARVIADGVGHLPPGTAAEVVTSVLPDAETMTTGQLKAHLRRLCIEADPAEAQRRHRHAVDQRRVVADATAEGTTHLTAYDLPPQRAAAAAHRINRIAQGLNTATESRTIDQLRADVFLDLLTGTQHHEGPAGTVEIRVDLDTLAELSEAPGELAGYGPVVADIARQTAANPRTRMRYTVTDTSGRPLQSGTTRRRPTAEQRRTTESRDLTCVFPGCRMPAAQCDLDHEVPWSEGGPTTPGNLVPLCRHDHRLKHEHGWDYQPLPDGDHQWTNPLGRIYTTSGRSP